MGMIENTMSKYSSGVYSLIRVVVGLLFLWHGISKFTTSAQGLFFVAGIVEVIAGAALVLGLFSRLAALAGAVTMVVALGYVHFPQSLNLMTNGGERAVLFLLLFLWVMVKGNGCCSLEGKISNKETF